MKASAQSKGLQDGEEESVKSDRREEEVKEGEEVSGSRCISC